jgi:hypothetical protein
MTSVPAAFASAPVGVPAADWRATQKDLWVARRDGRHLGTVERGRHYLAIDVDGEPIGTYRTLELAMAAVEEQCPSRCRDARYDRSWAPVAFVVTVALATAAMLGAFGLLLL